MTTLSIVYQDDSLIVIDKPAGLVVTPADTHHEVTVSELLQRDFGITLDRGGIAHRIDKDTSGILLAAKTQEALENLQMQFKERMVKKEYHALVHGWVMEGGNIKGSIERNPNNREKFIVSEEGRDSETDYVPHRRYALSEETKQELFEGFNKIQMRKLERSNYGQFTLLHCFPLTGRTHQVRVHLKHINHPIVGDEKYVGRKTSRLDHRLCPRQFLHAAKITLYHPKNGQKVSFESELSPDLQKTLALLTPET